MKTAVEILKKVLEIHIPAAQLGRPFLGTSITAVSICIMKSVKGKDVRGTNDPPTSLLAMGLEWSASP